MGGEMKTPVTVSFFPPTPSRSVDSPPRPHQAPSIPEWGGGRGCTRTEESADSQRETHVQLNSPKEEGPPRSQQTGTQAYSYSRLFLRVPGGPGLLPPLPQYVGGRGSAWPGL